MPDTALLTVEIGCEELPAWACDQVERQFGELLATGLADARLATPDSAPEVLVGPRRFAAQVRVLDRQPAQTSERRGPTVDAAWKDGEPTPAGVGFARSQGMEIDDLEVREADGRKFLWAVQSEPERPFADVFPEVLTQAVSQLSFGKLMRWGGGAARFVRPVRWVVAKLDEQTIPVTVLGVASGDQSWCHRFLGDVRTVTVDQASDYQARLREGHVVASQADRTQLISDGLDAAATSVGGTWFDPANVLREVVHLVEWPTVIPGRFDERYLELPPRVLITAMQSHQRYFPVRGDSRDLLPVFLTVMNGDPAARDQIIAGNERVLSGRLDDAVFSVKRDRERGLEDMAAGLGEVVFHAKAGNLAERTARIEQLALRIAEATGTDPDEVGQAARLCKADLVSGLVQEFAELQGFAGARYAEVAGLPMPVVQALDDQYLPGGARGTLPAEGVATCVALADRLDLLATIFAIGEPPTGSRDPHALRRAAIDVSRIIIERQLSLDLDALLSAAVEAVQQEGYGDDHAAVPGVLRAFIDDRVEKHLTGDGVRVDAVRAARAAGLGDLLSLAGLARALDAGVGQPDGALVTVFTAERRCRRLLEQAGDTNIGTLDTSALTEDSERQLAQAVATAAPAVAAAVQQRDFDAAMDAASSLAGPVDAFFDKDAGVMVMADDPELRAARLAILAAVTAALAPLGDLSELQLERPS